MKKLMPISKKELFQFLMVDRSFNKEQLKRIKKEWELQCIGFIAYPRFPEENFTEEEINKIKKLWEDRHTGFSGFQKISKETLWEKIKKWFIQFVI